MTQGDPTGTEAGAVALDATRMSAAGAGRPSAAGWMVFTLLGMAAWLGVTVYVAATNDDPSDATPILRTFAVAGAVFFALTLTAAALQLRRRGAVVNEDLYRRLAVVEATPGAIRAAVRSTRRTGHMYLLFTGVTTGLMLTTIGLGEDGPYAALLAAAAVVVVVWVGYGLYALVGAFRGTGDLLAPLGLSVAETPGWVMHPHGGGRLVGTLSFSGVRHGHQVTVSHTTNHAVVRVAASSPRRAPAGAAAMASLTGLPARVWRHVAVEAGDGAVTVRRSGNGAGRWFLHDILLAERVASSDAAGGSPAGGAS